MMVAAGGGGFLAMDVRLTGRRLLQVGEDAQDRRLAAAGRPQQRDERPLRGVQVDAVQGRDGGPADRELLRQLTQDDPPALLAQDPPFRLGFAV
jgi:hypothetical protein